MLIGRRQYERLTGRYRSFSDAYDDFTHEVDLIALELDPDELLDGTRDETHGRDVRL